MGAGIVYILYMLLLYKLVKEEGA